MIPVTVVVSRVDELLTPSAFGPNAVIRLVRSDAVDGDYVDAGSAVLQSSRTDYTVWDPFGGPSDWYKSRIESADGSNPSEYSAAFQAGTLSAYADVDDLLAVLPPTKADRDINHLADILRRASDYIYVKGRRDFGRHPSTLTGSEVRVFPIRIAAPSVLILPGIVRLDLVEYAAGTGHPFTALAATDWTIRESRPSTGYFDRLLLTDVAPISLFPAGQDVLRLTGVFGWAEVPGIVRNGTIALARLIYAAEATAAGAPKAAPVLDSALPLETAAAIEWALHLEVPMSATSRRVVSAQLTTRPDLAERTELLRLDVPR